MCNVLSIHLSTNTFCFSYESLGVRNRKIIQLRVKAEPNRPTYKRIYNLWLVLLTSVQFQTHSHADCLVNTAGSVKVILCLTTIKFYRAALLLKLYYSVFVGRALNPMKLTTQQVTRGLLMGHQGDFRRNVMGARCG